VYVPTSDSALLYILDARSGRFLSSLGFNKWYLFSSPAVAGNMLYVGTWQGKLAAIDISTGKLTSSFQTNASKRRAPAYTKPDGTPNFDLLYPSDFYDDMVAGVNRLMSLGAIVSSPIVVGKVVYVGSSDGYLYALM